MGQYVQILPSYQILPDLTIMAHLATLALAFCAFALIFVPAMSKPWYQGDGLPDCAPGKCPRTAEISPIKCSSDLTMYFNNGYPTVIMMTITKLAKVNVYFVRTVLEERVMRGNKAFVQNKSEYSFPF